MSSPSGRSNAAAKLGQETKTAMQELVGELDRTRKEYAKCTLQVTQLESLVEHMRDAEQKKDAVVQHLESEVDSMRRLHHQELSILVEEFKTKESSMQHTIQHLQLELARLAEENKVFSGFEQESRQLRDALLESQSKLERLQQINDDLKASVKDDMRDFRSNLESEFKRRLLDSEKKFRAEAYKALSEEAKVALQGNDQLQSVLQRQNDSIETVLARCKQLEQSHVKLKGEQESSQQNLQHHVAEVTRLRKQLTDTKSKNSQLEEVLKQRKVERASLELLFIEYESARKQLTRTQEKSKRYMKEAERWKARAMQLSYDVNNEQLGNAIGSIPNVTNNTTSTDGKLARARQQIHDVEESMRVRHSNASTAVFQGMGPNDWSDISDGDDHDPEEERLQARANITPMEILAMWNVNFEGWNVGQQQSQPSSTADPSPVPPNTVDAPPPSQPKQPSPPSEVASSLAPPISQVHYVSGGGTPQHHQQLQQQQDMTVHHHQEPTRSSAQHKRQSVRQLAASEDNRRANERMLSVLSQRKYNNIPAALQKAATTMRKERRPISMSELSLVGSDGGFTKVTAGAANATAKSKFIVP
eukprot:PhM_4_TR14799/c0_g1_i1/m.48056